MGMGLRLASKAEFVKAINTICNRMVADQEEKQIAVLNSFSNAVVIIATHRQPLRIEKHIHSCAHHCQLNLFGDFFVF